MSNKVINGMSFQHIALKCCDIEKSLKMYKALGMTEVCRWGEGEKLIVMLDVGDGGRIEFFANGNDDYKAMGKWAHFAVNVDDVVTKEIDGDRLSYILQTKKKYLCSK